MGKIADMVAKMMADGRRSADIVGAVAKAEAIAYIEACSVPEPAVGPKDFEEVWKAYPHKVSRVAADRAYRAARKRGIKRETILNGAAQYVASKPVDRAWMNLATFINQERWNDRPAPIQAPKPRGFDHFAAAIEAENGNRPDRSPENDPHHAGGVPLLGFGHH